MLRRLRKLVPRYSLRTLAVFMLLATSACGLWWRWGPWYCVNSVNGHKGPVYRVIFSPGCDRLLTYSEESEEPIVRAWDALTGRQLATMKGNACRHGASAFSRTGTELVTGGSDQTARLWNLSNGKVISETDLATAWPSAAAFPPIGPRVIIRVYDHALLLRDGRTGDEIATLRGHERRIRHIAVSDNGDRLLTTDQGNSVRVWDCADGRCLALMEDNCASVAFSPDGALALTSRWDGTATAWCTEKATALAVLKGHRKRVQLAGWSSDGKRVLTYDCGEVVRLWEIATSECLAETKIASAMPVRAFSSDGERVATGTYGDRCDIWSVSTGEHLAVLDPRLPERAPRYSSDYLWDDCTFSSDGNRVVSVNVSGFVHIWERRRPEWWWGVFYLWEFWLTAAFAALFIWSVIRDRRRLARTG